MSINIRQVKDGLEISWKNERGIDLIFATNIYGTRADGGRIAHTIAPWGTMVVPAGQTYTFVATNEELANMGISLYPGDTFQLAAFGVNPITNGWVFAGELEWSNILTWKEAPELPKWLWVVGLGVGAVLLYKLVKR